RSDLLLGERKTPGEKQRETNARASARPLPRATLAGETRSPSNCCFASTRGRRSSGAVAAPAATMGKRDPRPARPLGSFPCRSGEPARQASASARVLAQNLQAPLPEFGEAQVAGCRV